MRTVDIKDEIKYYSKTGMNTNFKNLFQKFMLNFHPYLPDANDRIINAINSTDKDILEIGCGNGILTERLSPLCHSVCAIDLVVDKRNEANIKYFNMDAHKLNFNDKSFDMIVGVYVLHHLNMDIAIKEIKRVLKPNGKAIFIEPLGINMIANIWRKLTPNYHTIGEKPISYEDIKMYNKYFNNVKYEEFNFLNLLGSLFYLMTLNLTIKKHVSLYLAKYDIKFLKRFKILKKYAGSIQIEMS